MCSSGGACKLVKLPSNKSLWSELVKGKFTLTGGGNLFLRGKEVLAWLLAPRESDVGFGGRPPL
jgi:hypothetical protein